MEEKPIIGVTMGDAAGIGPEIVVKTLSSARCHRWCKPIAIGDSRILESIKERLGIDARISSVSKVDEAKFRVGTINVLDLHNLKPSDFRPGKLSREAGRASMEYIEKAVELAKVGLIDAVVTAPVSKEAINKAGYHFPGHTEIIAGMTGTKSYAMMLVTGSLRVVHVTTHIPLRDVADHITRSRVQETIELAWQAMKMLGYDHPRIGVAGLNPHSSDGGLFGDEEGREIEPAVMEARKRGIDVEGPIPADTLFPKAASGFFDAVVAMYHDQGHIPVKLMGSKWDSRRKTCIEIEGVNITLGLPIIRTSVDHGTAFDIAGRGVASPNSLSQAVEFASRMARSRQLKGIDP